MKDRQSARLKISRTVIISLFVRNASLLEIIEFEMKLFCLKTKNAVTQKRVNSVFSFVQIQSICPIESLWTECKYVV